MGFLLSWTTKYPPKLRLVQSIAGRGRTDEATTLFCHGLLCSSLIDTMSIRRTLSGVFAEAALAPCVTAPARWAAPMSTVVLAALIFLSPADAASQQSGSKTELDGPECAVCEIVSVPLVRLGDAEGLGMLEAEDNSVRVDRRGRFFVFGGRRPYFWVFDSSGKVTHRIGRSGEGPGEFSMVNGIAIGEADSVFVFDIHRRLVSVYTPDLEFARTFRLRFSLDGPQLFFGASLLINTGIRTADRVGLPFHVLDGEGRISRSFGSEMGGVYRADMRDIMDRRVLARSDISSFWAARINQYLIQRWTMDGRLLETLHREPPWFEVWWKPRAAGANTPPNTAVEAMGQVGDTLWLLAWVPGERWRSAIEQDARRFRVTKPEVYWNAVLEAVDLKRRVVIASRRMPLLFDDLLEGGLAVRNDTDEVGNPVVWLYRLEIHSPSQ